MSLHRHGEIKSRTHVGKKYTLAEFTELRVAILSRYPNKTAKELAAEIGLEFKTMKKFLSDQTGAPAFEKIRDWLKAQT